MKSLILSNRSSKEFPPMQKLSKMTTHHSSKSLKISLMLACSTPLAGLTPSGMNTGRNVPHGVMIDKMFEVFSPTRNWWKPFAMSRSANRRNLENFSTSC